MPGASREVGISASSSLVSDPERGKNKKSRGKTMKKRTALIMASIIAVPGVALAEWTPLVQSSDFTGIRTDLLTAVGGIMSLVLIVVGVGILIRMFTK